MGNKHVVFLDNETVEMETKPLLMVVCHLLDVVGAHRTSDKLWRKACSFRVQKHSTRPPSYFGAREILDKQRMQN